MEHRKIVVLIIMLVLSLSGLFGLLHRQRMAFAQSEPSDTTAINGVLLPMVWGSGTDNPGPTATPSPTATPPPQWATQTKTKSGLHLGNRGSDWRDDTGQYTLLDRIGRTSSGFWPAAVVVQSDQLYDLQRFGSLCRVSSASVKTVNGKEYELYRYLSEAITHHNVKVVIRITPSPGNFNDYDNPGSNHTLRTDETPAGGNYCDANNTHRFRDILDVALEMDVLYRLNVEARGWPAANLFFEPANEPNNEWYQEKSPVIPNADNRRAWEAMDDYFAALYDRAKQINPGLRILAPSMSQGLHGEHYALGTCVSSGMAVFDGNGRTGLDFMRKVYGYDIERDSYTTPKADGFAWHNYWQEGQERWEPTGGVAPTLDLICPGNENYEPRSDHLFQYFSGGMQASMGSKPTFITEADLQSPCQNSTNAIRSKEQLPDGSNFAYRTRDSLLEFANQEFGASYVIVWLLVNQYPNEAQSCGSAYPNYEINWHEAYEENGSERLWFSLWWQSAW